MHVDSCVSYFYFPYPKEIQLAREKHFSQGGVPSRVDPAPSASTACPAAAPFRFRRMRSSPVELLRFSHGGGQSGCWHQGSGEKCGLEQILEALKLLLSPGGERTNSAPGCTWGLWAGSVQRHFYRRNRGSKRGMGTVEY